VSRADELTAVAREGYDGNDNKHLYSSPNWYAHKLGQYLHSTGRTVPRNVRMSRGQCVHANDMLFRLAELNTKPATYTWERVR
jgi:hypothetical protein